MSRNRFEKNLTNAKRGVDVLSENGHYIKEQIKESDSLGTKRVRKYFKRVGNEKSREGKIVEAVEQENEHDEGMGEALVTGLDIDSGEYSLKAKKYDHTASGGQEESSTANSINQRRSE